MDILLRDDVREALQSVEDERRSAEEAFQWLLDLAVREDYRIVPSRSRAREVAES
jgi:hypothetical protein